VRRSVRRHDGGATCRSTAGTLSSGSLVVLFDDGRSSSEEFFPHSTRMNVFILFGRCPTWSMPRHRPNLRV